MFSSSKVYRYDYSYQLKARKSYFQGQTVGRRSYGVVNRYIQTYLRIYSYVCASCVSACVRAIISVVRTNIRGTINERLLARVVLIFVDIVSFFYVYGHARTYVHIRYIPSCYSMGMKKGAA